MLEASNSFKWTVAGGAAKVDMASEQLTARINATRQADGLKPPCGGFETVFWMIMMGSAID